MSVTNERVYADPSHPGNKIRPRVRCYGCGTLGCITYWGNWCFDCNVKRIDRISGFLEAEIDRRQALAPKAQEEGEG